MKVNKFNIGWQITRLKAKKEKNYEKKIQIVKDYLLKNKNKHDKARIKNWINIMRMSLGSNLALEELISILDKEDFSKKDNNSDIKNYNKKELTDLLKDLDNRKYNFMYTGKPKNHIDFEKNLKDYLLTI